MVGCEAFHSRGFASSGSPPDGVAEWFEPLVQSRLGQVGSMLFQLVSELGYQVLGT